MIVFFGLLLAEAATIGFALRKISQAETPRALDLATLLFLLSILTVHGTAFIFVLTRLG